MRSPGNRARRIVASTVALAATSALWPLGGRLDAADPVPALTPAPAPAARPAYSALAIALETTRVKGVPTVAIYTSAEAPGSTRLAEEFATGPFARSNRGLVQVVTIANEAEPDAARAVGVAAFPSAAIYTRGPRGVALVGTIQGCASAADLTAKLRAYDLGTTPGAADPAVSPAHFGSVAQPSTQMQTPAPPPAAPTPAPTLSYSPPQTQTPPPALMYAPAQPVGLIQMPSQNLMIQQAPPQIYLAPTQAPMVYMPQVAMPAAPTSNMFLPQQPNLAAVQPQQQPMPMQAPAPQPMLAAAPMPALAVAAPQPMLAAGMTSQSLSLPSARSTTRVRVTGPGPFRLGLARLGERMVQLGRSRVRTVQETTLESPYSQSGPGLTTISSTASAPAPPPQMTLTTTPTEHSCKHPNKCTTPEICTPSASPQAK